MIRIKTKQTIEDKVQETKGLIYHKNSSWFDIFSLRRKKSLQSFNQLTDYCLENYDNKFNVQLMDNIENYILNDERFNFWFLELIDNVKEDSDLLPRVASTMLNVASNDQNPLSISYCLDVIEKFVLDLPEYVFPVLDIFDNINKYSKFSFDIQVNAIAKELTKLRNNFDDNKFNLLSELSNSSNVDYLYSFGKRRINHLAKEPDFNFDNFTYYLKNIFILDGLRRKDLHKYITGSFFTSSDNRTLNQLVDYYKKAIQRSLEEFDPSSTIIADKIKYPRNIHSLLSTAEKVKKLTYCNETTNNFLQSYLQDNIVFSKNNVDTLYLLFEQIEKNYNKYSERSSKDDLRISSMIISDEEMKKLRKNYRELILVLNKIPGSKHVDESLTIFLHDSKHGYYNLGFFPDNLLGVVNSLNKQDLVENNYSLILDYSNTIFPNINDIEFRRILNIKDISNLTKPYRLGYNNLIFHSDSVLNYTDFLRGYSKSFFSNLNSVIELGDNVPEKRSNINQWCNQVYDSIIKQSNEGILYSMLGK